LDFSTDSIIYRFKTVHGDPIVDGEHLGELKDEYEGHSIDQYWSVGPKAYALFLKDNRTEQQQHSVKVRSITLDHDTAQKVTADRIKEMACALYDPEKAATNFEEVEVQNNFRAKKEGEFSQSP
jgi:hypothetical protein